MNSITAAKNALLDSIRAHSKMWFFAVILIIGVIAIIIVNVQKTSSETFNTVNAPYNYSVLNYEGPTYIDPTTGSIMASPDFFPQQVDRPWGQTTGLQQY